MESYFDGLWWVRLLVQRGLAVIYLLAFVSALNQFRPLLGESGLAPVPRFLAHTTFREAPSLFHLRYSDRSFACLAWLGIALSLAAVCGLSEAGPIWMSSLVWFTLWIAYLSIVNVGQVFYSFGWESMLLEAGFFACFLGPAHIEPSALPVIALRWMLFRTEVGAGLIKLRHDPCWRDLTCLYYHYETQPLPNPLSWHFHHLPKWIHRAGVVFSHAVQLGAPFGLFLPQPWAAGAGALIIAHQLLLIVSGNYAWLNWLTVVLGFSALSDGLLGLPVPALEPRPQEFEVVSYAMALATLLLSIQPALNLFHERQRMNYNYNPLHIVNAYGAFGSVTRERLEIVLEGSAAAQGGDWREYEFRGKPGDPLRRPRQVAPYHLRLDWLMWFQALGAMRWPEAWFTQLVDRLLAGDPAVRKLLGRDPFPDQPPRRIRALLYRYTFTTKQQRAQTGAFWNRELLGEFHASER